VHREIVNRGKFPESLGEVLDLDHGGFLKREMGAAVGPRRGGGLSHYYLVFSCFFGKN
jgi:hypothetical protein